MSPALAAVRCLLALLMLAASHAWAQNTELDQVRDLAKRGELDRAAQQVDTYVRAHPKDPRGRFLAALVLTQQNRTDEAIGVYNGLIEDYPELPEPYNNVAALYAARGQYDAARDALERAVRAQPSYATAQENLGDLYARLAALAYAKAAELEPARASARQKLKAVDELVPPTAPPTGAR